MAKQNLNPNQLSNKYSFRVYRNAAWTPGAGDNTIPFDTKTYDYNNNFSTSTFQYTAPVAGNYMFSGRTSINGNVRAFLNLNVNGSLRIRGTDITGSAPVGTNLAGETILSAGDVVTLSVYTSGSAGCEVDSTRTYFSGRKVSD